MLMHSHRLATAPSVVSRVVLPPLALPSIAALRDQKIAPFLTQETPLNVIVVEEI